MNRSQLTDQQKTDVRSMEAVRGLLESWEGNDSRARAKAADVTKSLSSFVIEELLSAAGTEGPRREIRNFLSRIEGIVVFDEYGAVDEVVEWDVAEKMLGYFREWLQDKCLRWYKPNSTSNASVEIELNEHSSWISLYGAATGKSFF